MYIIIAKLGKDVMKAFEKGHRGLTFHFKAQASSSSEPVPSGSTGSPSGTQEHQDFNYSQYTHELFLFKVTTLHVRL